jgi:hypothetical protein
MMDSVNVKGWSQESQESVGAKSGGVVLAIEGRPVFLTEIVTDVL